MNITDKRKLLHNYRDEYLTEALTAESGSAADCIGAADRGAALEREILLLMGEKEEDIKNIYEGWSPFLEMSLDNFFGDEAEDYLP